MRLNKVRMAAAIVIVGLVSLGVVIYRVHAEALVEPTAILQHNTAAAWPADQTFIWTYPVPKDLGTRCGIELQIRRSEQPLPPKGGSVVLYGGQTSAIAAAEATSVFHTGLAFMGPGNTVAPGPGTAIVQLFDLKRIGAVSVRPGQTLRVIANRTFGGAMSGLSDEDAILPAGSFGGTTWRENATWANNELYLMSFYVQGDTAVYKYDVLLQEAPVPGPH
jgi:hypothetical protein